MSSKNPYPASRSVARVPTSACGETVSANSFLSNRASFNASGFQARIAFRAGCSGSPSRTEALSANVGLVASAILKIRLILAPVQDAFANDIVESDRHKSQVDHHLPEPKQTRTGDSIEFPVDHCPRHHEHGFHVEQDKEHRHQVKAHAESAACIPDGNDAALVGIELDFGIPMPPHKPGGSHHHQPKPERSRNLHQEREILPEIGGRVHFRPIRKESGIIRTLPARKSLNSDQKGCWFELRFLPSSRQGDPTAGNPTKFPPSLRTKRTPVTLRVQDP